MRVTSPSYLLDNCYKLEPCAVHHMDLYRLPPGKDLSFLGIPEIYATSNALCSVCTMSGCVVMTLIMNMLVFSCRHLFD